MTQPDHDRSAKNLSPWRRYLARVVLGVTALIVIYQAIEVYSTYQREQRIARDILVFGKGLTISYRGPRWIPASMQDRLTIFGRITRISLSEEAVPADLFQDLGLLTETRMLNLEATNVSNADLQHLSRLTKMETFHLGQTNISDSGLIHLYGMKDLRILDLRETKTTVEGRNLLHRHLPNCTIKPDL